LVVAVDGRSSRGQRPPHGVRFLAVAGEPEVALGFWQAGAQEEVSGPDSLARALGFLVHRLLSLPPLASLSVLAVYGLLVFVANWTIVKKTGRPGCLSLLFYVPLANLVLLAVLAFVRWPVEGKRG
jgi:hypothetical protein